MQGLLQAVVEGLQRKDGAAARLAYDVLMAEAGPSSGARTPTPLPPAILDACAALLEEGGPNGSTAGEILKAVNTAAIAGGTRALQGEAPRTAWGPRGSA